MHSFKNEIKLRQKNVMEKKIVKNNFMYVHEVTI